VRAIGAGVILAASLALTACGNNCPQPQSLGAVQPVSMSVPMPAPVPAPKPPAPAPRPPAPKAPAPAPKTPAPKPPAPKVPAKPVIPKPPPSIYRPTPPIRNYRDIYVRHQTDHTPLLILLAMNGAFSSPQPIQECESR
jgi:outer membrane biosynthesis protein TonB